MGAEFTDAETAEMTYIAEQILRIIARGQGRAESYAARQDLMEVIHFPDMKIKKEVVTDNNEKAEREKQAFLKKKNKEISKMPKKLQDKIKAAITRPPRLHNGAYEKRATINGVNLYGCHTSRETCEALFLEDLTLKLPELSTANPSRRVSPSVTFSVWADRWMEEVYKPSVGKQTYENESFRYRKHIRPYFEGIKLKEIAPIDCIRFFNQEALQQHGRTAESCYGLLNRILQFAVESNVIPSNPMSTVKPIKHERENGVPLSKEEECAFLQAITGKKHELVWIVALYTGIRPCEYPTVRLDGDFIVAQNMKQKTKKIVYKRIPVTPMLKPYVARVAQAIPKWEEMTGNPRQINKMFKEYCPGHTLKDLRTTFATRTQECGVPEPVVQNWMGHSSKSLLGRVYTKFSDEYLLSEGNKVKY